MSQSNNNPIVLDFNSLKFLSAGKSGIVYAIDEERILKEYDKKDDIEAERLAFARLGSHTNIVRHLGATSNGSIILERGQPLRTVIEGTNADKIPLERKLRWLRGAAEGIQHMHQNRIIHADIGCHNMVLVQDCVKIIDFEGSSIDSEEATSSYEWFSYQDSIPAISQKTDIFAFGCAIYEIMTGKPPHHDLAASNNRRDLVKRRYAEKIFPEVANISSGTVMQSCWNGTFNSMSEVLQALEAISLPNDCLWKVRTGPTSPR
ncbi:kinase-like domain-containing protein [Bisporella sp. PMI_857]|nr:kinase-like domain-containing protein [Bisporella sp. PMI_857]